MANEIAPLKKLPVDERIKEMEKFLAEEEAAITKAPFKGEYKTPLFGFTGKFEGDVDLPVEEPAPAGPTPIPTPIPPLTPPIIPPLPETYTDEMLKLLSIIGTNQGIIIENQNLERRRWERCNPLATDSPVYDWNEATIDPGFMVTFTLTIPEGSVFFFEYFNISYNDDTTYNIYIDGVGPATLPTLAEVMQDFGDHNPFFKPPRLCYTNVEITALNNGVIAQTYSAFIRGFFRQQIKTDKEYLGQR